MTAKKKKRELTKLEKFWKFMSDTLDKIMLILFLLIFCLGIYSTIDIINIFDHTNSNNLLKYKPTNTETNNNLSDLKGSVAWLTLDDTNIDCPIMQGIDNKEYLNKDPEGNFSLSGSLFLDYRNSRDFTDYYSLIYGHHMEYKKMFGQLDSFKDKAYLLNHENGELIVNNKTYNLKIFACVTLEANDSTYFDPEITQKKDIQSILRNSSTIKNTKIDIKNKRILALSTCQDTTEARTVVLCAFN